MQLLKRGSIRFYFPEHPDHPYNGCTFNSAGSYAGTLNGLPIRKVIESFEDTPNNNSRPSGYWDSPVTIKASDFIQPDEHGFGRVLVTEWTPDWKEQFYLSF
jgi:hypothetical protein